MATTPEAAPGTAVSADEDLGTALAEVLSRLSGLAGRPVSADQALGELADLEVAGEELRVAEEEMRVQQEQLAVLLRQYEAEHAWRSQLSALVPVGLCVTDAAGKVLDANPALAAQLQVGLHRLRGKPLSVFLDADDVPGFRSALRALTAGEATSHRGTITLRGRVSQLRTELFGFPEPRPAADGDARVQWVLMPESRAREPEVLTDGRAAEPSEATAAPADGRAAADAMRVAATLAELSTVPGCERDRQRMLGRIAGIVAAAVPGCRWVSVVLGTPLSPALLGSDSPQAQAFDGQQMVAQEGPCVDAHAAATTVLTADVRSDSRWPALGRLAERGPVRSVLAVPIRETAELAGVLNLYSPDLDAFDARSRRIAELVATAVSGALQSAAERRSLQSLAAHLEQALTSRAVIDQAKGMIMARLGVDADTAFARLVALSNRLNVKVRDLAALVTQGHLEAVLSRSR